MDIYSTLYMGGVVRAYQLKMKNYFLDTFFPSQINHTTEKVAFDTVENTHRIARFVHPDAKARVTEDLGYSTQEVKPAYIKELRVHTPDRNIQRLAGEPITGNMTPEQRSKINMNLSIRDAMDMIQLRKEYMAFQACLDAKVSIVGEGLNYKINFGRNSALTFELEASESWADPTVNLHKSLTNLGRKFFKHAKVSPTHVLMNSKTFSYVIDNETVEKKLDLRRGDNSEISVAAAKTQFGIWKAGRLGQYDLYVYENEYQDPDTGDTQEFMPDDTVLFLSSSMGGVRHYGMIHDFGAKLAAREYYADSWTEKNPSKSLFQIQSSPLMVPYRPNCSMKVRVVPAAPKNDEAEATETEVTEEDDQ